MTEPQFNWNGERWSWLNPDKNEWEPVGPGTPQPDIPPAAAVSEPFVFLGISYVWWILGALVLVIGGCSYWATNKPTSPSDQSAYVKVACRDWVKPQLKSPSTAEFPGSEKVSISGTTFTVTGSVDSQNGFGATVRSTFTCVATHTGETTKLVSIKVT